MKRRIQTLMVVMAALFVLSSLAGCGSGKEDEELVVQGNTNATTPPAGLQPNIHENVPPPESQDPKNSEDAGLPPNSAENFFNGKEAYDDFSEPLKDRIYETYHVDPSQSLGGNGNGYYNTLLGRTSPVLYVKTGAKTRSDSLGSGSGTQMRVMALEAEGADGDVTGCDPTGSFLCLDSPETGFETVHPGIDVVGKIDLNQLAVFGAGDPVIVVSVFNNSGGGASAEIPIMPGDVEATSDPNIAKFTAAVGLTGAGKFTIVVSAFRVINEGAGNELFSIMVNGTRIEAPEIEFVNAVPSPINKLAEAEHETDPVENNAVIAADFLNVKVKLLTAGGAGIQVKFDDTDENDELQSSVVALPSDEGTDTFFTGVVPLHQGVNKITVTARSPALDQLMGDAAPEPSVVTFTVFNADGGPRLKLLKPEKDGVVAQTQVSGQKVDLQFCYTFVPSKVTGSSGGETTLPSLNDTCKTGQLGFTPDVYLNGTKIVGEENLSYDATQGTFTVKLEPRFGVNIYEISSVDQIKDSNEQTKSASYVAGALAYGVPMKLIDNGQIAAANSMTKRGLNVDIDKGLIETEVKEVLLKFLNRPETSDLVLGIFKKTATTPGYVCHELENQVVSAGDTSIEFLEETFSLGPIEISEISTSSDGMLHVAARINGMHGKADLRAVDGREVTYYGQDVGFLPLKIDIARLDVNIGVTFAKKHDQDLNQDGVLDAKDDRLVLDIRKLSSQPIMSVIGDGELGNYVSVDVSRNPHAAGAQFLDEQQGLIKRQFQTSLEGTFVCGIEAGLNHPLTGALGKSVVDLEKLTSYNQNFQRLPFSFALLGKTVALDIAYNLLRSEAINIDSEGLHIVNAPLRFNPGPSTLTDLASDFGEGLIGAVSRWIAADEPEPSLGNTSANHRVALGLGEDVFSQIFSAAALGGLIDLDIDANFYTDNKITPNKALGPMGGNDSRLANDIDANLDGRKDDLDKQVPLLLKVRTDKRVLPMLTFLSEAEVHAMAETVVQKPGPKGATPEPEPTPEQPSDAPGNQHVDPNGRYFRLTIPNLELAVFRSAPVPENMGGVKTFCEKTIPISYNPTLEAKGICKVLPESKTLVPIESLASGETCPAASIVKIPAKNGHIVSYQDVTVENADNPRPLYRIKVNLLVHGEIKGFKRTAAAADFLTNPSPPEKTKVQLRLVPNTLSETNPVFITSIQVLENNTGKSDATLADDWNTTLTGALASPCERFNEIMIPIPEKFAGQADAEGNPTALLPDFGIDSLDIGVVDPSNPATLGHIPAVYIDDSRLYLDILAYVGLELTEVSP